MTEFDVDKDGKKLRLAARMPTSAQRSEADMVYAKGVLERAAKGVQLEENLRKIVRDQHLWDDEKEARLAEIDARLEANEAMLPKADGKSPKKGVKLSELRKAAVRMRVDRLERQALMEPMVRYRGMTAEGMAEQDRFNCLVALCVVHADSGKPYFASTEEYLKRGGDPDARVAAEKFAAEYYKVDPDVVRQLPENAFLLKYKMCADDGYLALVGPDGKKVDVDGKPIVEQEAAPAAATETFDVEDDWTPKAAETVAAEREVAADGYREA
jgi:hypothetical protein